MYTLQGFNIIPSTLQQLNKILKKFGINAFDTTANGIIFVSDTSGTDATTPVDGNGTGVSCLSNQNVRLVYWRSKSAVVILCNLSEGPGSRELNDCRFSDDRETHAYEPATLISPTAMVCEEWTGEPTNSTKQLVDWREIQLGEDR